jgi:hypothetical protein
VWQSFAQQKPGNKVIPSNAMSTQSLHVVAAAFKSNPHPIEDSDSL